MRTYNNVIKNYKKETTNGRIRFVIAQLDVSYGVRSVS